VLLLGAVLGGCAAQNVNPVTGKAIYAPVTPEVEADFGRKANDRMIAGEGAYTEDAALSAYVDRIGQALAKYVVRKDIKYTFTILDDDEINAFALPGGYVYVTRGTLNFANSEAELAAILGHEIGHIDAFHFGHGGGHDMMKTLLAVLLMHSSKNPAEIAIAQKLAVGSAQSTAYSQQQEYDADALGIHYMALAGYDPQAAVAAMRTEDAKAKLDDNGMKGNPVAHDLMAMDQSHPDTPEREIRAAAEAKAAMPASGADAKIDRDDYLAAIDGMAFGADPVDGTLEGHRLVNATFGFSFDVPEDFDLWPGHSNVFGFGRDAMLVLEATDNYAGQSLATYVQSSMMPKMYVNDVRPLEIDGYRGATGTVNSGAFMFRLAAIHDRGHQLYRLLYAAPSATFERLDAGFIASLKSFHPLQGAEANPKPSLHLKIVTVAPGDTVQTLSARMALKDQKTEWFRVLNELGPDDAVKAGDRVKVVE
jgi:predicted Zn-dependent protease